MTPPATNGRLGIIGNATTKIVPTSMLRTRCSVQDMANHTPLNDLSASTEASPIEGSATPASRLIGIHTLPASMTPHAAATTAIAAAPAKPPMNPLRYG